LLVCLLQILKPLYSSNENKPEYYFGLAIIAGSVLQIYLYLQFNMYHDIQTQGKYILPALPGLLLLLVMYVDKFYTRFVEPWTGPPINTLFFGAFMGAVLYVHAHAMYKYIIPFYYSNAFVDTAAERFSKIDFLDASTRQTNDLKLLEEGKQSLSYEVIGHDPWLSIKLMPIDLKPELILARIGFKNNKANFYHFYWDGGEGMSEFTVVKGFAPRGENTIYQIIPVSAINTLRFDFGEPGTEITVSDMAYAGLKYKPLVPLLNKLFNVKPTQSSLPIKSHSQAMGIL
jgi:hypothetical protein